LFVCIFNFLLPLVVNKDVQFTGGDERTCFRIVSAIFNPYMLHRLSKELTK